MLGHRPLWQRAAARGAAAGKPPVRADLLPERGGPVLPARAAARALDRGAPERRRLVERDHPVRQPYAAIAGARRPAQNRAGGVVVPARPWNRSDEHLALVHVQGGERGRERRDPRGLGPAPEQPRRPAVQRDAPVPDGRAAGGCVEAHTPGSRASARSDRSRSGLVTQAAGARAQGAAVAAAEVPAGAWRRVLREYVFHQQGSDGLEDGGGGAEVAGGEDRAERFEDVVQDGGEEG